MKKLKLLMLSFALTCLMGMTVSAAEVDEYGYTRVEYVDYTYGSGWVRQSTNIQTEKGEKIALFDLDEGHERGKSYMEDSVDTEGANVYHVDMQAIVDYDDTPEEILTAPMLIKINIPEIKEDSKVEGWAGGRPSQTSVKAMNISSQGDGYVIFAYEGPIIDDCYICITVRGTDSTETNPIEDAYDLVSRDPMTVNLEGEGAATVRFEADKSVPADVQSSLTVESGYSVYYLNVWAAKVGNENETVLANVKLADPVTLRLYASAIKSSGAKVKVYHFNGVTWDDSPQVIQVEKNYVDVMFTELSPIAIAVDNSVSSSTKKSSGSSGSGSSTVEEVRFTTALSPAAEVSLASGAADLQIGPPTRTFYESDGQALLGTTDPISVYLADFWLVDRATGAVVTPGADGAIATINIPGVTASSKVMIRQWPYGTDEYIDFAPVEIGNGYIKVKFTTMSQAAICVAGADAAVTADTATAAATTEKVSPKTSDSVLIYAAEAIALVSILGFVICRKKSV